MAELIVSLFFGLFELLFLATGSGLIALFGWRQPHELVRVLTGVAFWAAVGTLGYTMLHVL